MGDPERPGVGELHDPIMRRLRDAGRDPRPFHQERVRGWLVASLAALALTVVLPLAWPQTDGTIQRTTPLLSLFFMLAAAGAWVGLGTRTFPVAGFITALLYGASGWTWFLFDLHDFYIVALLSSFLIFALAGFNLVFILEEMVFDLHRHLPLFQRPWSLIPALVVTVLIVGLPFLSMGTSLRFPALFASSSLAFVMLWGWWFVRAFNPIPEGAVLRELHLLATGAIAASLVADVANLVGAQNGLIPSLIAYLVLIGTWLYVSYTTLQRTHFLLPSNNTMPWILILLSASFALLNHAQLQFQAQGFGAIDDLLHRRLDYLVIGIWIGMAFYVVQSTWRLLRLVRDDRRVSPEGRLVAGRLARVAENLLNVETRLVRGTATFLFQSVAQALSGRPRDRLGVWEMDSEDGGLHRLDEEE